MDAIVAENLTKRYKAVQALDGVSFAVRDGEVFALLGPNGGWQNSPTRATALNADAEAIAVLKRL